MFDKMFELTVYADYCVYFGNLSETMRIRLLGADYPDKFLYSLHITWYTDL